MFGCDFGTMTFWGWTMMAAGWLAIAAIAFLVVRSMTPSVGRTGPKATALEVLDDRFARGELNVEEYRERRSMLETSR